MNPTGFPRSAFEAVHDESSKFRQLPCRTLISVGVCPYREKCKNFDQSLLNIKLGFLNVFFKFIYSGVFLHDPRCVAINAKSITRLKNKNKDDCIADSLYWPAMPRSMVMQYPENEHNHHHQEDAQPHTVQPYCVPVPQQDQYRLHDAAVYSMWMHFVDFCLATASPSATADSAMCYAAVDVATNPYARSKRLPVFRTLCRSQHVPPLPNVREDLQYRRGEYKQGLPTSYQQPPQVPLTYSNQNNNNHVQFQSGLSAPVPPPAPVLAGYAAPAARAAAPLQAVLFGASAGARTGSSLLNEPLMTVSSVLRSPASPAPLVRRQSASSPVSITEAGALEYDTLNGGFDDAEDLVDVLDLNDDNCGLGLNLGLGGDFASSLPKQQNLAQIGISPMLLQSIF